jgi:hypothetical protein
MSDMLMPMPVPFEPKKKNRWQFRFPSDLGIHEFNVISASRPKLNQEAVEIPYLNTSTWVLGRSIWEPITVVLRDAIGPSTAQAVMEWERMHFESTNGRQGYAAGYKRDVELEMLGPAGVAVEGWILEGTMITSLDFGDLSMDDDGLATISMDLRFDRADLLY